MRSINQGHGPTPPSSQVLSIMQSCALNEPLLPNLQTLMLWLAHDTQQLISFIPLLLSARTTTIDLIFFGSHLSKATIASAIATFSTFPTLCPNLRDISLVGLERDPMITAAVSELALKTNHNTLRSFCVDSPLTDEARKSICKHPDLHKLRTVIDRPSSIPTIILPNLTDIYITYDDGHDWLHGFRGASLGKLTTVTIFSRSSSVDGILGAFECVALTTSIPKTLSAFRVHALHPWKPSYRSLLPFTQLNHLVIDSPCKITCSSTIDDDTITDLAQAMPKLEVLGLGGEPCSTRAGVTAKGLVALAYYCPHLSDLTIHFQVTSLDPGVASVEKITTPREGCALHTLHAGWIPVPEGSALMVALTLLHIFPRLKNLYYSDMGWEEVSDALGRSKNLARCLGEKHLFVVSQFY